MSTVTVPMRPHIYLDPQPLTHIALAYNRAHTHAHTRTRIYRRNYFSHSLSSSHTHTYMEDTYGKEARTTIVVSYIYWVDRETRGVDCQLFGCSCLIVGATAKKRHRNQWELIYGSYLNQGGDSLLWRLGQEKWFGQTTLVQCLFYRPAIRMY